MRPRRQPTKKNSITPATTPTTIPAMAPPDRPLEVDEALDGLAVGDCMFDMALLVPDAIWLELVIEEEAVTVTVVADAGGKAPLESCCC